MGLFYLDSPESFTPEQQREENERIQSIVKECLEFGEKAPNEAFPDFLWNPQLNEYEGDEYKIKGACENPNVLKAYTIRRKYSDYWGYIDALDSYVDYIKYLESLYGSFEMVKNAVDTGMSSIYIPKRPKLTNKKENKKIILSGFTPSRIIKDFIPDDLHIIDGINKLPKHELSEDEDYKLPKNVEKLYAKEILHKVKSNRVDSIYATKTSTNGSYLSGTDAIVHFLTSSNDSDFDTRGNKYKTLSDQIEEEHEFDYLPQSMIDEIMDPNYLGAGFSSSGGTTLMDLAYSDIENNFLISPKKKAQEIILMKLTENGYDFLNKSVTAHMDKEVVRAVMRKYGSMNTENLTPKQIKKLKKKEAKKRKEARDRFIGDRRLTEMLLQNRISLNKDLNSNFRFNDVFSD